MLDRIRQGCSVGFFGFGRSNASLLSSLPLEKCKITVRSDAPISCDLPKEAKVLTGEDATADIDEDILFFSPSVRRDRPPFSVAKEGGCIFSSDAELFFENNERPLFSVTGSDGKSSTAALCEMLLTEGGRSALSVGNMGEAMFEKLAIPCDMYVAELSSFMLTYSSPISKRACLTSLSPNHLDWHKSYEEYKKTKINLLKNAEEFVVSSKNSDIKGAFGIVSMDKSYADLRQTYSAELYLTSEDGYIKRNGERLIEIERIRRREGYNLQNFMMALAMTDGYVGTDNIYRVAGEFSGLKHRCEKFLSRDAVDYYDSSIDTSPARTVATLRALNKRVVIILGGRDKGLDYSEMLPELKKYVTEAVITGENREKIYQQISKTVDCHIKADFSSAVKLGIDLSKRGGALLLSPAAASYDNFKDYAHRGDEFQKIIFKEIENEKNLS